MFPQMKRQKQNLVMKIYPKIDILLVRDPWTMTGLVESPDGSLISVPNCYYLKR